MNRFIIVNEDNNAVRYDGSVLFFEDELSAKTWVNVDINKKNRKYRIAQVPLYEKTKSKSKEKR